MWLAKRLKDIAADLEKLTEEEKKMVIYKLDQFSDTASEELYNTLNEYMGFSYEFLFGED